MNHLRNSTTAGPAPALVLALGALGREVAADVAPFLAGGDRRRAAASRVLVLGCDAAGELAWQPLHDATALPFEGGTRREIGRAVAAQARALRRGVVEAVRDLHTHERLDAAGLGDVLAPPLDLFVLADLTEAFASGALIPVVTLLQDVLARAPEGEGHLLLSAAGLPLAQAGTRADARAYTALAELDRLLDPIAGGALRQALGGEGDGAPPLCVYLFDRYKEGTRAVKDRRELRTLMGNFLLALLSGGLAQRLARRLALPEMVEQRAFYGGGAATALIFEPGPLVEACAGRLGAEFLAAEVGPAARPDPRLAGELAAHVEKEWGDLRTWLERSCANSPCEVRAGEEKLHLGLHFCLHFERKRKEDWAGAIRDQRRLWEHSRLPRCRRTVEENVTRLAAETLARQARIVEVLPQAACLYPGGLQTTRLALQKLEESLADRMEALATGTQAVGLQELAGQEATRLEALEDAAWNFPDLPALAARLAILCLVEAHAVLAVARGTGPQPAAGGWLGWIAAGLLCAVTLGAGVLWLWRKDRRLIALRERCVRDAEERYAAAVETGGRDRIFALCARLQRRLARARTDLDHLERALREVETGLGARWAAYARRAADMGRAADERWHPLFRPTPADGALAEWVYGRWRQAPAEMRRSLLNGRGFLANWRTPDAGALLGRMLNYGRQVFQPALALTLDEVLGHKDGGQAQALARNLAREAVPPLRVDLDPLGGGGQVHNGRYLLVTDAERSAVAAALAQERPAWAALASGDPYVAICCRVRQMLPLAAMRDLVRRGQSAYQALEADERRELHLFDEGEPLPGADRGGHAGREHEDRR